MPPVVMREVIHPTFLNRPACAVDTLGDEAAELAVKLRQDVGEEERIALRAMMPVRSDGMPAGLASCIIAGRRNVKSWAMEMALIHDAWITKVNRCLWSAHLTKTSDENFAHLRALVTNTPWLDKRVAQIYGGNGNHSIVFKDLGTDGRPRRIDFMARQTGRSGRGQGDVNRLFLDEWLYGTGAMLGAIVPMMGAATDRYMRYGSSPGLLTSESLRALRERGRRGGDPSLSYVEWTSERIDADGRRVLPQCADPECSHIAGRAQGCFLDDEDIIRRNNPAYGRRLDPAFIRQERLELPPVEFMRERCGIWEDPPTEGSTDDTLRGWADAGNDRAAATAPISLAFDVSSDLRSAAIGIHGGSVVELVEWRKGAGTGWVGPRVAELMSTHGLAEVGVAAGSPAMSLVKKRENSRLGHVLEVGEVALDVRVIPATAQVAACQAFATAVNEGHLAHRAQQVLGIAVRDAVRVLSGDGWRWSRSKSPSDISPLWAVVLAAHLGATAPPPVDRSVEALLRSFG